MRYCIGSLRDNQRTRSCLIWIDCVWKLVDNEALVAWLVPRLSTWYDVTWYDMTWHDGARCDMTWHDVTWHDVTLRDMTWRDMACHDVTWGTWRDMTWHDVTWREMTWHNATYATWRDATSRNMTWHDVWSVSQRNKNELYCMWDGWDIVEKLLKPFQVWSFLPEIHKIGTCIDQTQKCPNTDFVTQLGKWISVVPEPFRMKFSRNVEKLFP